MLENIDEIVNSVSQADPTFSSKRIYTPLTAKKIHKLLQSEKGYKKAQLPTVRTILNKLADLDIRPKRVKKCQPTRKIAETDAIFEKVHEINATADNEPRTLRISLDCKAEIKIGPFSRGGKNRVEQKASDHDFASEEKLVPFGIFLPKLFESHLWFSVGPVTADFMVDRINELWTKLQKRFPKVDKLVINADNGPENSGQRTQWINRISEFSITAGVIVELAYYPPYHSKHNPVERLGEFWRITGVESY